MVRVGVLGAQGRMGKQVVHLIQTEFSSLCTLDAKPTRNESLEPLLSSEVVIDFSGPEALLALTQLALSNHTSLPGFIVGSTGLDAQGTEILKKLSEKTLVLKASNFSVGIFLVRKILEQYSPLLKKAGYTPTLLDIHHQHKKDAPSGTALSLQKAINPVHPDQVQTQCFRVGEVFGDHDVTFYGKDDAIKIAHTAQNRTLWARGAIQTALWLAEQKKSSKKITGILSMDHYFDALVKEN